MKQRGLLAVLLLRPNELVPTARIIDELWGEQPPATAVKTVQVFVSQLRKVLGEGVLETQPGGYLLRVPPGTLDAQRFESLLDRGRRLLADGEPGEAGELLRQALALWRGPALADFQYEAFARNEIGRLDELRVVALEHRLEADLALGRHGEVVGELEALVRDQPLRERPRALLLLALYRSGRQADALAAYQEARSLLVDELGLDPGQALQQLEKAILRQDPALELPAAAAPPPPQPRLVAAEPPTVEQTEARKIVTMVFCELSMDDDVDPESLRLHASQFLDHVATVVERHGGKLERRGGDDVTAVFGVPVVREDDALRAVRAALELRELVELRLRLAVVSGEVVTDDQGSVAGSVVAAGRRLVREAELGEIVLGESTYAAVEHAVTVTRSDSVIRLESLDPDAVAVPRRDDSRFVGRGVELERLRSLYDEVVAGNGTRLVTVIGEPGIGKSRLAREAVALLDLAPTALIGRCPPYGEGVTFWPLREVIRQAGNELDLDGTSQEVFGRVRHMLLELAAERPVAVLFDDVHWAEPTFLDLVEYLAASLGDARVLIVCLARPQLADQRPTWLQPPAEVIALEALSGADSELLLESLGAPAAVRTRIAEAAEGNPLFAEQLAEIASEVGSGFAMPGSIRGVLHERLDRLEREERAVLERASVAGRTFTLGAVSELSPREEAARVHERLLSLVRKRFVRLDPLALDEGFRFQHALIRDATYDAMPKTVRADLHERFARWTAETTAAIDVDETVGYHLYAAVRARFDLDPDDAQARTLADEAVLLLERAGQRAVARQDGPAAAGFFERTVELLPAGDPQRPELLIELGEALRSSGRLDEAENRLREAEESAAAAGMTVVVRRAALERAMVGWYTNPAEGLDALVRAAEELIPIAEQTGNNELLAHAWTSLGLARLQRCEIASMQEALELARLAAQGADGRTRGRVRLLLALAAVHGPTPADEALRLCHELTAEAEAEGDRLNAAKIAHHVAYLEAHTGRFEDARARYGSTPPVLDELGDRLAIALQRLYAGRVELLASDPAAAEAYLRDGVALQESLGDKGGNLAGLLVFLGDSLHAQGKDAEAEEVVAEAIRLANTADVEVLVGGRSILAELRARAGSVAEAEELAREVVAIAERTDASFTRAGALLSLATVLRGAGSRAESDDAARRALAIYEAKGSVVGAAAARRLLAPGEITVR